MKQILLLPPPLLLHRHLHIVINHIIKVDAEKTNYMVMSRDQNAGQNNVINHLKRWSSSNI
jgi:predicted metal-dependent peptidase